MIIVDFIDMDKDSNRVKVLRAFEEALRADKAKANVTKISELGLVEMTRKRTRESLGRMLTEPCSYCDGKGYVKSKTTVCAEILRRLRRDGNTFKSDGIVISCNSEIADLLVSVEQSYLEDLEKRLQRRIIVSAKKHFHVEKFELSERRDDSMRSHEANPREADFVRANAHDRPLSPLDVERGSGEVPVLPPREASDGAVPESEDASDEEMAAQLEEEGGSSLAPDAMDEGA
jgi:hypothetical protein